MLNWLTGKKTYIGAGILAVTGAGGYFLGVYDLQTAGLILGAAVTTAGLGHKGDRIIEAVLKFETEHKK